MATRLWKFLINTFFSRTVESMKNALSLTQDHLAKLTANEADADILAIKTDYLPVHTAFLTAVNQLDSKRGIYKGKTQSFEEALEELARVKINEWRGQVFAVFPEGTANAVAIFPRDRQPFQQDTYDERVEAVQALSITLGTYTTKPTLITLSATVAAYYITISGARALQQTDEGSVATLRTNLKAAHKLLCDGMYKNLGLLMAKYYQTPEVIANYFDLTLIRNTGNGEEVITEEGSINSHQVVNLNELTGEITDADEDTTVTFTNTSTDADFQLILFGAATGTELPGTNPQVAVNSGESIERPITDPIFQQPNLNIYNPNNTAGSWQVVVNL